MEENQEGQSEMKDSLGVIERRGKKKTSKEVFEIFLASGANHVERLKKTYMERWHIEYRKRT